MKLGRFVPVCMLSASLASASAFTYTDGNDYHSKAINVAGIGASNSAVPQYEFGSKEGTSSSGNVNTAQITAAWQAILVTQMIAEQAGSGDELQPQVNQAVAQHDGW